MQTIRFSSLNLFHLTKYGLKQILPFRIENFYISKKKYLNIVTDKKQHIIIYTKRNSPYMYISERTLKKIKHGFNDVLSTLLKGRTILEIKQFELDRIIEFITDADIKVFVQFIPGKFNLYVTDKQNTIINQYSFLKNREGNVLEKPGKKYIVPDEKEIIMYLNNEEKEYIKNFNIMPEELLKKRIFYTYIRKNTYHIIPFIVENETYLDSSENISELIEKLRKRDLENEIEKSTNIVFERLVKKKEKLGKEIALMMNIQKEQALVNELYEKAETIKMHLNDLKGKNQLIAMSIINPEKKLTIELDRSLNAQKNMEKYFKEMNKVNKRIESNRIRLKSKQSELSAIIKQIEKVENGEMEIIEEKVKKQKDKKRIGRTFISPGGFKIVAGRSAIENDRITTKIASKKDIFFHAREKHGSHIILVTGGRIPAKVDIEYAASIAAYYSAGKHSSLVAVSYTEIRYVTKKRKSKPGEVYILNEKVIFVSPIKI